MTIVSSVVAFDQVRGWPSCALARGGQADISLATDPHSNAQVVIKTFRDAPDVTAALARELQALGNLAEVVSRVGSSTWHFESPRVVAVRQAPPALALTFIPGRTIDDLLESATDADALCAAGVPEAIALALRTYWQLFDEPIGDLNLKNLLCDPGGRRLGLIDPGWPGLETMNRNPAPGPAAMDLGYLFHDVFATNVRLQGMQPGVAARREHFVAAILRECLAHATHPETLLEETIACAVARARNIQGGTLFHHLWRRFVSRTAAENLTRFRREFACS